VTHAGVRSGFLFERLISVTSDDGRASALASPRSEAGLEEQLLPMAPATAEVRLLCTLELCDAVKLQLTQSHAFTRSHICKFAISAITSMQGVAMAASCC
jgi:hypothetical protein